MRGIFIASALVVATSAFSLHAPISKNTVQDAFDQGSRLIRCWDPVDMTKPNGEYFLSEPIYELCSYMPFPGSFSKFYVNGVRQDSDDYSAIMSMFAGNDHHYATLNVCLQEVTNRVIDSDLNFRIVGLPIPRSWLPVPDKYSLPLQTWWLQHPEELHNIPRVQPAPDARRTLLKALITRIPFAMNLLLCY